MDKNDITYIDKFFILERLTQEEIFEFYMGRPIEFESIFHSPIRPDEHPTCTMASFSGKILYRDWAHLKAMDCFDFVMKKFMIPYGVALEQIVNDFNLLNRKASYRVPTAFAKKTKLIKEWSKTKKTVIKVRVQEYTSQDIKYLKSFYITSRIARKFRCYSIESAWIQHKPYYRWKPDNPALGYYLGDDKDGNQRWKIYYYNSNKPRFIGNTNRINGWVQLPDNGKILVITKSMKDVMVLAQFGIPSIAMQSENTMPYQRIIDELNQRFALIITLLDFDGAGIMMAQKIKKAFGIKPLFLTNGSFGSIDYESKDISDYVRDHGIVETEYLLADTAERLLVNINPIYKS